jgi:hypothetical protein
MHTLPNTKSSKGDVGGVAYRNTNMHSELATYVVFADIYIEPFFLAENEKKSKKHIKGTYRVVL